MYYITQLIKFKWYIFRWKRITLCKAQAAGTGIRRSDFKGRFLRHIYSGRGLTGCSYSGWRRISRHHAKPRGTYRWATPNFVRCRGTGNYYGVRNTIKKCSKDPLLKNADECKYLCSRNAFTMPRHVMIMHPTANRLLYSASTLAHKGALQINFTLKMERHMWDIHS